MKQQDVTIEHLAAALAHAEGYIKAVRNALNLMEGGSHVSFPSQASDCLTGDGTPFRPGKCPSDIFKVGCCPPPIPEK